MVFLAYLSAAALLGQVLAAPPLQIPLQDSSRTPEQGATSIDIQKKRPLHGRFLQITDFHPDPFYEIYSSTAEEDACHRGHGPAGIYGAETSECDSPIALVNKTMDFVARELRDQIDFVIWTGDSARHDNDDDVPRSEEQVLNLNRLMVQKMKETFGKHNGDEEDDNPNNDFVVPIVPNLGNNDILPHNIMLPGPNKWTRHYAHIWRHFIPEVQKHQFEQGGWFYVEVIPHHLAVFSLNTLYFFSSNAAADGCAQPSEPGYQQLEWLRIQLQFMRDRGMKAILIGHVPPVRQEAKTGWEESCWQKYTLWLRQYRDVIVSSHYGHFNYGHMILQDFADLRKGTKKGKMPDYDEPDIEGRRRRDEDDFHALVSPRYFTQLRDSWSDLPEPPKSLDWPRSSTHEFSSCDEADFWCRLVNFFPQISNGGKRTKEKKKEKKFFDDIGGKFAQRYAASFVSASVVPNLFPTFRIFEYNITGLQANLAEPIPPPRSVPASGYDEEHVLKQKKYKFEVPASPSKSAPPGPAYSPQMLSLLRYKQYYANLTYINNDFSKVEEEDENSSNHDSLTLQKWHEGKHKGKHPHDKGHVPKPKKFKFGLHYDTLDDDVYQLPDLTMPHLLNLARRVGDYVPQDEWIQESAYGDVDEGVDENHIETQQKRTKKHGDTKSKKKSKSKKGKKELRERNKAWYTFIRRAFVETLDEDELRDDFGLW